MLRNLLLASSALACLAHGAQATVTSICSTSPNSVGPGALLQWQGAPNVQFGALVVEGLPPSTFGTFLYSYAQMAPTPFGDGVLCVGGPTWNLARRTSNAQGVITLRMWTGAENEDLHWLTYPGNQGFTWSFQFAYRDLGPGGHTFNTSDGVALEFGVF